MKPLIRFTAAMIGIICTLGAVDPINGYTGIQSIVVLLAGWAPFGVVMLITKIRKERQ